MEKIFKSPEELQDFAVEFIDFALKNRKENEAFFVRLKGDLGTGKTMLTQAIGKHLGVSVDMQSPTFALEKFYKTTHDIFKALIHIDAYRIEDPEEANILALDKIKEDPSSLVLIEWPEKIETKIPRIGAEVLIEHVPEGRRLNLNIYGEK